MSLMRGHFPQLLAATWMWWPHFGDKLWDRALQFPGRNLDHWVTRRSKASLETWTVHTKTVT